MAKSTVNKQPILTRNNPNGVIDLTDITATNNTNLVIGVNPVPNNTVSLIEGFVTRIGDKAFISINFISDEGDRVTLTMGNTIVPIGASIVTFTIAGDIINSDQINPQVESDNQISFDVSGTTADVNVKLGFWVKGYPDFLEYELA